MAENIHGLLWFHDYISKLVFSARVWCLLSLCLTFDFDFILHHALVSYIHNDSFIKNVKYNYRKVYNSIA